MRLCFVDNHNFQILSFILQINNSYQIEALKLICSIFQMFARQCDKCLLAMMIDIWFCLEITTIAKIILITMALRLACSNYFHFSFFCFFQKNPTKWQTMGERMKKEQNVSPDKKSLQNIDSTCLQAVKCFCNCNFFRIYIFFSKKKGKWQMRLFCSVFSFLVFSVSISISLSLSLSLLP